VVVVFAGSFRLVCLRSLVGFAVGWSRIVPEEGERPGSSFVTDWFLYSVSIVFSVHTECCILYSMGNIYVCS